MRIPPIWVVQKAAGSTDILLKLQCTDSLIGTYPWLWQRGSNPRGMRDIQEKSELCEFRVRTGRRASIIPV